MKNKSIDGKNGCDECRQGVYSGQWPPPKRISVHESGMSFLHRCDDCGTFWDFTLRYAAPISLKEAQNNYPCAFDHSLAVPFSVGQKYHVKKDFSYLNHQFHQGEEVSFDCQSYDFREGVMRYWFGSSERDEKNIWHVWDRDPDPNILWREFFEEIKD